MKAVKVPDAASADDKEALRDLVRLLARLAAVEHVRANLQYVSDGSYDGARGRS